MSRLHKPVETLLQTSTYRRDRHAQRAAAPKVHAADWRPAPNLTLAGWAVIGELRGWRFRIEIVPSGLRLTGGETGAG